MVSTICALKQKILQAELGGNNSVLVLPEINIDSVVPSLVTSAFSFSGQRCTANRRFIVDASIAQDFIDSFIKETKKQVIGDPYLESTDIGPLITKEHHDSVIDAIHVAVSQGAEILHGGKSIESNTGYWVTPTILKVNQSTLDIVQRETFGPVVIIQISMNFEHALLLANSVSQGLVSCIVGGSADQIEVFKLRVEAGILKVGITSSGIDVSAPFSGWKESSIGVPEHGRWDKEFYSRVQVIYE